MSERTATLTNVDRAEYGVITVDLDLLDTQIHWLASLGLGQSDEQEGLLNLLGGIMDLADPPPDEDDCHKDTENVFIVGGAQP